MGLQLVVEDCDAVFARAVGAGAAPRREPEDQFYGARAATIRDPWGHEWMLFQPIETVNAAMMAERLAGTEYGLRPLEELDIPEVELGQRRTDPAAEEHRPANRLGDMGYFTIDVPDPDAAADFFSELLGWHVEQGHLDEGRHIASIAPPGGIHGGRPPGITLYFRVDDLQAAAAKVRELGGEVLSLSDWPTGGNATCRDTQGLTFELWKPAPGY
jgi:predicted enzyme related to lactoylglutathione lyase